MSSPSAAIAAENPTIGISESAFTALAERPARHRQAFAATRPNGNVFAYVRNSLNGYAYGWSEGPGTLHPVVVFNGLGVAQGVDDSAWSRYSIADVLARAGATLRNVAAGGGNPWLHAPAGLVADASAQTTAYAMDASIETLSRRGTDWLVCDTAMITLAMAIAGSGDIDAVHRDLRTRLVPGAHLVPSGASAMDALQAEHFSFYDANV